MATSYTASWVRSLWPDWWLRGPRILAFSGPLFSNSVVSSCWNMVWKTGIQNSWSMNAISVCLKCQTIEHQDRVFVQQSIIGSCLHKCSTGSKSEKCLYPGIFKHIPFCKTKQTDRYCILISICSPCQWEKKLEIGCGQYFRN